MFIGFYAEWRAGSRGEMIPHRQRRNRFAAPVCSGDLRVAPGDVLPRTGFRAPGFAGLFVGKVEQSRHGGGQSYFVCSEAQLPAVRFAGTHGAKKKRFRICMIGPLFSDLRVEGERQTAHSHLNFELAIRVPIGRNGFGFIVQTQDVCAGDRKVAQPAFDLRAVMRRRFKKVDI